MLSIVSKAGKKGAELGAPSKAGKIAASMIYWCNDCQKFYKSAGGAGKHAKKSGHKLIKQ